MYSKNSNKSKGDIGENLAIKYLISKKFEILDRNVHLGKLAELDIIAKKDGFLHFIEVKSVYNCGQLVDKDNFPVYNITKSKLKKLSIGIRIYLQKHRYLSEDIYIDAISIIIAKSNKKAWIKFFPNILEGID